MILQGKVSTFILRLFLQYNKQYSEQKFVVWQFDSSMIKQDINADSSHLTTCHWSVKGWKQKIPKDDFGHFWLLEQHANAWVLLAQYDFLLLWP